MAASYRTALYILALHINQGWCIAEFELFPGFGDDITTTVVSENDSTLASSRQIVENFNGTPKVHSKDKNKDVGKRRRHKDARNYTTTEISTSKPNTAANQTESSKSLVYEPLNEDIYEPFLCPEEERPLSIGPYEVPTRRDLAKHMNKVLRARFNRYHKKSLLFLNDIKEATRGTSEVERKCPSRNRVIYKKCVKHVSNQCEVITKSLVTSLEAQRHDVAAFTEKNICNFTSMNADPVQLIKILAMEEAALEFALSGFLRLLSACEHYCENEYKSDYRQKPARHMSDQDLVIKHFLTRKNYLQLLKGTP